MINVLELRPNPNSKSNGIDKYCNALRSMFADDNINILPVMNYPMKKGKILKERYVRGVLDQAISNQNVDIIHINGFASFSVVQMFWHAKMAKKKIVYTAHWHPFEYLNHPLRAKLFFYFLLKPLIKWCADVVVTINNEDTAFFKSFHKNVKQIPHWIEENLPSFCPSIEKDPNMVLFVGRFNDSNKGAEHLLYLPEGKYNIHCVGPCNGELRSDMVSHVNISFEELRALYSKASLLVVPSRYEAFSYVALEALSNDTPVLLSDRVRISDYLKDIRGVNVFQYHNYKDFCNKVNHSIGGKVDIERIKRIFSESIVRSQYRNLFHSLYPILLSNKV